jgi:hypothetical protein
MKATHEGTLNLGGSVLQCYVLEDGRRVLSASGVQEAVGSAKDGNLGRLSGRIPKGPDGLTTLPRNQEAVGASKNRMAGQLLARIPKDSEAVAVHPRNPAPIKFSLPHGGVAHGYDERDITQILRAYQRAFLRDELHHKQVPIAKRAMALLEGLADVGLRALIDEATGVAKSPTEHRDLFGRVFLEHMASWELMFDAEWDRELCRLYGHQYTGKPPRFGAIVNDRVWRFALGIELKSELKRRNPNPRHRSNHGQYCAPEAREVAKQTIRTCKAIAKLSVDAEDWNRKLSAVFEGAPLQLTFLTDARKAAAS